MAEKNDEQAEIKERAKDFFKRHRLSRYAAEGAMRVPMYTAGLMAGGLEEARKFQEPEQRCGLIVGAILAPRLCFPDSTLNALVYKQARAGQFMAYDFNRAVEFPIAAKKKGFAIESEGTLWAFMLDSIRNNSREIRTPNNLLNWFSMDHLLSFDKRTPDALVEEGYLDRLTHAEAYDIAGQSHYIDELCSRSLDRELVYQVTPKGNSLVGLSYDDGESKPKEDPTFEFGKIQGLLAH